jgi:acetoacetate decarboxylase
MTGTTDRPHRPTREDILKGGFSTPWDAPMTPPFPFTFRDVEVLTAVYRTDPDAIARLLPPPLEPVSDKVLVHVYRMGDVDWLGAYGESNVMIGAHLPGTEIQGGYSPYLFLDHPVGIVQGREVHGQPKKYAEPRLTHHGDTVVGRIARDGIDVVTITGPYKQHAGDVTALQDHIDFRINLNLKAIDHIDGRPAIRQITARQLADVTVHECWRGPCTVELRPHVQAPVYRLPVVEAVEGFHWRTDFTLVQGTVAHDYLAETGHEQGE